MKPDVKNSKQNTQNKRTSKRTHLETARDPFTRWIITLPPARWIRSFSVGKTGLWSCVEKTSWPALHRTARESPQLATNTWRGEINAQTAVDPDLSSPLASSGSIRILSSRLRKPERMPLITSDFWNSSVLTMDSSKCSAQWAETRAPAWPSNTWKC